MSSLWFGGRSGEAESQVMDVTASSGSGYPSNLTSLLAAAGSQLPVLPQENLTFVKAIGKGSSFEVNKMLYIQPENQNWSSYYVAVKHMIVVESDAGRLRRHYDSVHRELRALTHPGLKDHDNILPVLALGWTNSIGGACPYLVVEWSDHGTLTQYLRRIPLNMEERRELALDVAAGLKALHETKIIHGDMKPSNILIFDTVDVSRPQMAKLADFGGSIFEMDEDQQPVYGGTAMYNAPEQEGRVGLTRRRPFSHQELYLADTYSFGLTLWEIMNSGNEYFEDGWLKVGETKVDALHRICAEEEDGILKRARLFCRHVFDTTSTTYLAVLKAFNLTLIDQAQERAGMAIILQALGQGAHEQRPQPAYPNIKIHPSQSSAMNETMTPKQADGVPRAFTGYKLIVRPFNGISVIDQAAEEPCSSSHKARDAYPSNQMATIPTKPPSMVLSQFHPGKLDLFQMGGAPNPPWDVQHGLVQHLQKTIGSGLEPTPFKNDEYLDACLQLAICYHIGFGIRRDQDKMLHFLSSSLPSDSTREFIYSRIVDALSPHDDGPNGEGTSTHESPKDNPSRLHQDEHTYFGRRILQSKRVLPGGNLFHPLLDRFLSEDSVLISCVMNGRPAEVDRVLSTQKHEDQELSKALYLACKKGNPEMAIFLCHHCKGFIPDPELPTPLHWLMMFDDQHAEDVIHALILGVRRNTPGPCNTHVNDVPSAGPGTFFLAEHCAEFFGAPLHWAVRARRPRLAQLLAKLGADINIRWSGPKRFSSDVSRPRLPYLSPLDVAVVYHLPEVTQTLIDLGAQMSGGAFEEIHSAFQCIGLACVPFSRYIIHGRDFRKATKETINVLVREGCDVQEIGDDGYDPLMTALRDPDCEAYIIEELLDAGAQPTKLTLDDGSNAAVIASRNSVARRHNSSSLALVAPRIDNVHRRDRNGRSPIHYAAIGGSAAMAEVLIELPQFEINAKASCGRTALHFAAEFGSAEVTTLLIQKGANMEVCDANGLTPLQSATSRRNTRAAHALLNKGAQALFLTGKAPLSKGSVLHAAVAGASSADTVLKELLEKHIKLRESDILNATDGIGWTALYKAAYFGDYVAVDTLLSYGADRNVRDSSRGPYPGRNAKDKVEELLRQVESRGLGPDHKRIRQQGDQAKHAFLENLREIKRLLEDG